MPISYNGAEEITFEVIKILADNMATELDTLEGEYTGELALTLEDIQRFYFGEVEKPPIETGPAVMVIPGNYDIQTRGMANINADNVPVRIKIIIYLDPNAKITVGTRNYFTQEILTIKVIRYLKAMRNILLKKANRSLTGKIDIIEIRGVKIGKVEVYENMMCRSGEIEAYCHGSPKSE